MKKLNLLTAVFLAGLLIAGCSQKEDQLQVDSVNLKSASAKSDYDMVPNEILVKFKEGTVDSQKALVFEKLGGKLKEKIVTKMMQKLGDKNGIDLVSISGTVANAVLAAKNYPEIEYAEPNYIYTIDATSVDPYFANNSLWGMNGTYGCGASSAWANGHTGSSNVVVGVIDEGIQYTHPDLVGQIWTNPFDPVDGIDNDGNGYIDDIHGWDFDGNDNVIYDGGSKGTLDDHGTHVSGTIGGKANTIGVVGVNWNVTIISTKFLGRRGGNTANAIKAVDYLTDLKARHGMNIVASNNSWGGGGFSQAMQDAITRAGNAEILFIAAAGNGGSDGVGDNNDAVANYPSNYTNANVIAVAAITSAGAKASYSNYGATTVDLGAPGSGIWSTTAFNLYESYNGTSMATPHVTGAAALYASTHPGASAAAIKSAILSAAVPTASLAGKCVTGGRLNVSGF